MSWQVYISDTLQVIAENTAIPASGFTAGKAGKAMTRRWVDRDKPAPPEETRTEQEIIDGIAERARA